MKKEPKQELLPDFKITKNIFDFVTDLSDTNKEEPKQETLEEAARKWYSNTKLFDKGELNAFIAGVKWQTEKMPVDILKRIISFGDASPELMETSFIEIYEKSKRWLEQNKKK